MVGLATRARLLLARICCKTQWFRTPRFTILTRKCCVVFFVEALTLMGWTVWVAAGCNWEVSGRAEVHFRQPWGVFGRYWRLPGVTWGRNVRKVAEAPSMHLKAGLLDCAHGSVGPATPSVGSGSMPQSVARLPLHTHRHQDDMSSTQTSLNKFREYMFSPQAVLALMGSGGVAKRRGYGWSGDPSAAPVGTNLL